jgi:hypothetical protein
MNFLAPRAAQRSSYAAGFLVRPKTARRFQTMRESQVWPRRGVVQLQCIRSPISNGLPKTLRDGNQKTQFAVANSGENCSINNSLALSPAHGIQPELTPQ